jgi:4-hydroxy-tetrahydrodipicolinate reductase
MTIRVCVAGATGWTGSAVTSGVLAAPDLQLKGAVSRRAAGRDIGEELGVGRADVIVSESVTEALSSGADVLVDYTAPQAVKRHVREALERGVRVVVGTSGLDAKDYAEIEAMAIANGLSVIAAGNFSITAALAKHFSLLAARYLPSWEIVDYASASKVDAPSGTVQELAEQLGEVRKPMIEVSIEDVLGAAGTRGQSIAGSQVHSIRLPSYVIAFETIFGLPDERLTIRHDAGSGADPYVAGTLLAVRKAMQLQGLVRGLDQLLFDA